MTSKVLALLLLASAAARADKAWVFEPGQALVSVELGPAHARLALTSLGMSGRVRELDDGSVQAEVRVAVSSFTAGSPGRDRQVREEGQAPQFPEIVFQGSAASPGGDGTLRLQGSLTFHGISRPLSIPVTVVRTQRATFGHVVFALHLRDFGLPAPAGASDEVRIEVDAGLRPEGAVASRG